MGNCCCRREPSVYRVSSNAKSGKKSLIRLTDLEQRIEHALLLLFNFSSIITTYKPLSLSSAHQNLMFLSLRFLSSVTVASLFTYQLRFLLRII